MKNSSVRPQCRVDNRSTKLRLSSDETETIVTLVLLFEIILRFSCDWRNFHRSPRNWVDLGLAVITALIQIPPVHRSREAYAWLSIFQILRIYRVVLAVSLTRQLIVSLTFHIYECSLTLAVVDRLGEFQWSIESRSLRVPDHLLDRNLCSPNISWRVSGQR